MGRMKIFLLFCRHERFCSHFDDNGFGRHGQEAEQDTGMRTRKTRNTRFRDDEHEGEEDIGKRVSKTLNIVVRDERQRSQQDIGLRWQKTLGIVLARHG